MMKLIFALASVYALIGLGREAAAAPDKAPATQPAVVSDPGTEGDGDVRIGPHFKRDWDIAFSNDVPKGIFQRFDMESGASKIYPGVNGRYYRMVGVYVPAQYVPGTAAPFIVVQDGLGFGAALVPTLDNLIAKRKLPIMIAILINSGGGDLRREGAERRLEYDTLSDRYAMFIETEVLPTVAAKYDLKFTSDPEGRATMGGGSGGAAAFTMAWFRPDLYRRVLAYSGTFINRQPALVFAAPHGAWEYHEHFIPNNEPRPLRIWLEAGEFDDGYAKAEETFENNVIANNRMAAALKAKRYHYRYVFACGAEDVEWKVVQQTLPEAMPWLWRGYPIK